MLSQIPTVLNDIIIDYKEQLDISDKKKTLLNDFKNSYIYNIDKKNNISQVCFKNQEYLYCYNNKLTITYPVQLRDKNYFRAYLIDSDDDGDYSFKEFVDDWYA